MKTTPALIKTACCELLQETFPEIKVYGNDTFDGYVRPSFFTELRRGSYTQLNSRVKSASYSFIITYFEETHSEADCFEVLSEIESAFQTAVRVNGRHLVVDDIDYQWIDTNADKMQITIDFAEFAEIQSLDDVGDRMETLEASLTLTE